jgi:hypothetical protein
LLHEALETVLHEAMARDVIHEVYKPRTESLDVVSVLSSSVSTKSGKSDRFPVRSEGTLPFLHLDSQLLKYIHRNAVSNAIKYGKIGGTVDTVLSYDGETKNFQMKVINEKGKGHDQFIKMTKEDYNKLVFAQGTSLHGNIQPLTVSSGDGAWIMQKCAKTMGGSCSITFEEDKTIFVFSAPAEPLMVSEITETKDFVVPESTIGVAIDDSKIQRKLMARILGYLGIVNEKTYILGESPAEILELNHFILGLLTEFPNSKLLILMDENLDFKNTAGGDNIALSGSVIMQGILESLSPAQQSRILALVRSANDSTADVAMYTERTHGFLPKAPMLRERVREIIAPLWAERFHVIDA